MENTIVTIATAPTQGSSRLVVPARGRTVQTASSTTGASTIGTAVPCTPAIAGRPASSVEWMQDDRTDAAAPAHPAFVAYLPGTPTWSPPIC